MSENNVNIQVQDPLAVMEAKNPSLRNIKVKLPVSADSDVEVYLTQFDRVGRDFLTNQPTYRPRVTGVRTKAELTERVTLEASVEQSNIGSSYASIGINIKF